MRLNVKLPEPPNKEQPHLTRFQAHNPPHLMGTTLLGIECEPSETVAQLKAKVAALCGGAQPEMLRKGGSQQGVVLEDSQSLADCGLTSSMDIFEHLWVDSAANQAAFRAEYETMAGFVKTHRDLLDATTNE